MGYLPEGTVTFLFSDVEGSTLLLERHGAQMGIALARHHELFEVIVARHSGVIFETVGDAVYAAFARPTDAVAATLDAHRDLAGEEWGAIGRVAVRVAIHTGEVLRRGDHYFGSPLFRAARLQALGYGEQTLLSGITAHLVADGLPADASLRDLGTHRLKDLGEPEHVYQLQHPQLRTDFPAFKSLDAHPHNLPLQLSSFVGRQDELAAIDALLTEHRLVTLLGPGGIGKTRLALQVAADRFERHPDGVFWVDLSPTREPELVPGTVATVLGLRNVPGQSLTDTLLDHLRPRQMLIMLDNLEQLLPAVALTVAELLKAAPALRLLLTSRAPMRIRGEHEFGVPTLTSGVSDAGDYGHGPAVELFVERARAVRSDLAVDHRTAAAMVAICNELDGLPLAIELATARLRTFSIDQLQERLSQRLPLLTSGPRDLPERQQTLRATIAWSEQLLREAERRCFAHLAVFVGGFTFEAADAVVSPGLDGDLIESLTVLIEHSLVRQVDGGDGEPRYSMLETIRDYAAERLQASGETDTVRLRHVQHFAHWSEEAGPALRGPEQAKWLDRLEEDRHNIEAAITYAVTAQEADLALRTIVALDRYWNTRGALKAAAATIQRSLTISGGSNEHRGAAMRILGMMLVDLDEVDRGMEMLDESIRLLDAAGASSEAAAARLRLGDAVMARGDFARSIELITHGREQLRELNDQTYLPMAEGLLGTAYLGEGNFDEAEKALSGAKKLLIDKGDSHGAAITDYWLAIAALRRGDHVAARDGLDLAKTAVALVGDLDTITWIDAVLARLDILDGQKGTAMERIHALLNSADIMDDPSLVTYLLESLAYVSLAKDRRDLAQHLIGKARAYYRAFPGSNRLLRDLLSDEVERALEGRFVPDSPFSAAGGLSLGKAALEELR